MLWVGFVVLGNIFVFEISEKKWWDLSKEEEEEGKWVKEEGKGEGEGEKIWVRGKNLKQRRGRPKTRCQSGGKVKKISGKSENF